MHYTIVHTLAPPHPPPQLQTVDHDDENLKHLRPVRNTRTLQTPSSFAALEFNLNPLRRRDAPFSSAPLAVFMWQSAEKGTRKRIIRDGLQVATPKIATHRFHCGLNKVLLGRQIVTGELCVHLLTHCLHGDLLQIRLVQDLLHVPLDVVVLEE